MLVQEWLEENSGKISLIRSFRDNGKWIGYAFSEKTGIVFTEPEPDMDDAYAVLLHDLKITDDSKTEKIL